MNMSKTLYTSEERRIRMREKYLKLAEQAERDGDKERAEKMRLAASRC